MVTCVDADTFSNLIFKVLLQDQPLTKGKSPSEVKKRFSTSKQVTMYSDNACIIPSMQHMW